MEKKSIKIIVASKNPVKVKAVKNAFEQTFPNLNIEILGVAAQSGVADQPITDEETLQGAINRVNNIQTTYPNADYWVGVEGGVHNRGKVMDVFGWMVIRDENQQSEARSSSFPVPPYIAEAVNNGEELGHVNDRFFDMHNSKHGSGAVGTLTDDLVTRMDLYVQPLLLGLIPFKKPALWK